MSGERILTDGSDLDRAPPSRVSATVVGLAGLLAGTLGALALTGSTATPPTADQETGDLAVSTPTTTNTEPPSQTPTLFDQVPGFSDTLVSAGTDASGSGTVERWRAFEPTPDGVPLPAGDLRSDVSRMWLRIVSEQRYGDGRVLWVGNDSGVEPVSTDVIDAVWNESITGRIAWLEPADDGAPVVHTRTFLPPDETIEGASFTVADTTRLRWYTRAGVTVEVSDPEPRLVTVRPDGTRIEGEPGDEFIAGTDHFALIRRDGAPVLVDQSLRVVADFPSITGCRTGEFAPFVVQSHRRVGLSCQIQNTTLLVAFEIEVSEDGSPGEITNLGGQPILGLTPVSWSGRDRFITTVLPINGPVPESIVTIWDVEKHEAEVVRWEGARFSMESMWPRRLEFP